MFSQQYILSAKQYDKNTDYSIRYYLDGLQSDYGTKFKAT